MGAITFERTARGRSMGEAWDNLCEEEHREHGDDLYSGSPHLCSLVKDVTSRRGDFKNDDAFVEWILDRVDKRDAYGYCTQEPIKNNNKIKTQVENFPQKGTRKWKTVYEAIDWQGNVRASSESQTECIKKARAYVEKHPDVRLKVCISKKLTDGNVICAEVNYKPSSNERLGTYTFVGKAPY